MTQIIALPDGRQASYQVSGDGVPALMLPGGPGFEAGYLAGDAGLFAGVMSSYLIDPPGAGASTPPRDPSGFSAEAQASFYEEVRKALGLPKVVVFGHSFGASVALAYAAAYPESTVACVAVAPFTIGAAADAAEGGTAATEAEVAVKRHAGSPWYPRARQALDSFGERVAAARDSAEMDQILYSILPFYLARPDEPGMQERLAAVSGALKTNLAAVREWVSGMFPTFDLRPLLGRVSSFTLIIAGEYDLICGPAQARSTAQGTLRSQLVILEDCGHLPALESPGEYRQAVLEFLRGLR